MNMFPDGNRPYRPFDYARSFGCESARPARLNLFSPVVRALVASYREGTDFNLDFPPAPREGFDD